MTKEEIKQKLNALLGFTTPENQANASEILTALSDEIETIFATTEEHTTKINELTANNETLRAVNAKLFLKVGATDKENHTNTANETETESENKITFESLFNDKGELL